MSSSSLNEEAKGDSTGTAQRGAADRTNVGFVRSVNLRTAVAINMTQMCGIGPFITIPLMVAAFGGPQAILGWIAGALLALADGLIWAELGAAMPGAGGTYIYLREAFQYRTGRLMPFIFTWTAVLFIPLIMSTGINGLVSYLGYLWPNMTWWQIDLVSFALTGVVLFALYRRIESIGILSNVLFVIMLISIGTVIVASFTHFNPTLAFSYPSNAFTLDSHFFGGLGAGLIIGIYDYLGYNTTAYMGAEVRNPGRVVPWSIMISIFGMMLLYLALNIGVMGVVPWQVVAKSNSVASLVLETAWGKGISSVVTVLILITAFASVFAGLLGGSRVPYNAARDGVFLRQFGKLHPRYHFPHVALIVMCIITAVASILPLGTIIAILTAVIVIVQALGQVAALTVLRRRQPDLKRPYRMWLYPLFSILALIGWVYVFVSSGLSGTQFILPIWTNPMLMAVAWTVLGIIAYLFWARFVEHTWPFGPKEIKEEYLERPVESEASA
ncbi:APC family permease [Dictyobacter formicarum]|uniref:Amino acid permease n=1 Tax=Dictyobacter formicarum TaxID=2778368 RepID=A0ABQ3VR92_9CHLR|nr:APC family permease [Dictyobacter formicarum]GHO88784.1 amino acid permease [Dictyobacter formicarum]